MSLSKMEISVIFHLRKQLYIQPGQSPVSRMEYFNFNTSIMYHCSQSKQTSIETVAHAKLNN